MQQAVVTYEYDLGGGANGGLFGVKEVVLLAGSMV